MNRSISEGRAKVSSSFLSRSRSSSNISAYASPLLLPFTNHTHNSLLLKIPKHDETTDDDTVYNNKSIFIQAIQDAITFAKANKKSSIWIQVPMSRSSCMELLQPLGFQFHHAQGYTTHLYLWLHETIPCKIPDFATHQVGVGAVVINRKNEILCVRELRTNYRPWKIPSGLAELGEHLDEAVIREVREETGIECIFQSVLGVRHTHKVQFGRSDLFFVCRLKPIEGGRDDSTSTDCDEDQNQNGIDNVSTVKNEGYVKQPIAQEGEIDIAAWIPLEEYKAMVNSDDDKLGHPMMKEIMKVVEQSHGENDIQQVMVDSIVPGRPPSPVYHAPFIRKRDV